MLTIFLQAKAVPDLIADAWGWELAIVAILLGAVFVLRNRKKVYEDKAIQLDVQLREKLLELGQKNNMIMQQSELIKIDKDRLDEVNERMEDTLQTLQEQKKIIEESNNKTLASIRYAQRIQRSILPNYRRLKDIFKDSFIIYLPRDIVSGDFYWFGERDDKVSIAAIDCTGHGVPGAFMSLIGYSQLNRAYNEYGITDPGRILVWMDRGVTQMLRQSSDRNDTTEGMEVALLTIDFRMQYLSYSGAHRPLYVVRNGELIELKGEMYAVGGDSILMGEKRFRSQRFEFQTGDCVYMFSDGYVSQFGGKNGSKYSSRRLKELLSQIGQLPCPKQKRILKDELDNWRQDIPQIDDILIMGFRIQ